MYCGVHAGSLTGAKEEPQAEGPGKWAIQGEQDSARKRGKSPVT